MSPYRIEEVDGDGNFAAIICDFNRLVPEWPPLQHRHYVNGHWWFVYLDETPIAFAGMVPFEPFPNVGYFKRAYVLPDHRGHGLQQRLMVTRETRARQIGVKMLVSECLANNEHSAANFRRQGFELFDPEQPWGATGSVYWRKTL